MKKRLISFLLALVLVLTLAPGRTAAVGGPVIRCTDCTAAPGDWVSIALQAENLEELASLELWLSYDPQVLQFQHTSPGWLLDGAVTSTNEQEPGMISLTAAAAAGISGEGTLMYLYFSVAEDCAPGAYPLSVVVGEAYDAALSPVSISAQNSHITVTDRAPSYGQFHLGLELSADTLTAGDSLTVTVCNSWYSAFASCDLTFQYDPSMFTLVSARAGEGLEQALCSLNTAAPGLVRLTCASVDTLGCWELLTVELQAKSDDGGTAALTARITDVYDSSRIPYQPGEIQGAVTIVPDTATENAVLHLESAPMVIGEESVSTLILGAGSGLAAADFRLDYDPALLECVAVEAAAENGYLIINPNFTDGSIRFSLVEEDGITGEMALVTIRWKPRQSAAAHYAIRTTLTDPVDKDLNSIIIDAPVHSGCIFRRTHQEPTCSQPGGDCLTCTGCGKTGIPDPTPALGHDYGEPAFRWSDGYESCTAERVCSRDGSHVWQVDCTITHVSEGESCTAPGSVTYTATADFYGEIYTDEVTVHKDSLGHDYAWTVITEPGCTTEGLRHGDCIRCDAVTDEVLAPLGHAMESVVTEPVCTEGGYTTQTCTRCGNSHITDETPALGHDWSGTVCRRCGETRANPFVDVPEGSFYYDPVIWAVENSITNGTSATTFGPNDPCMRAHVVTFLWRAAGSPEPAAASNPFVDVKPADFYYKAVLWAVENGITNGLDATHFGPFAYCNRAQVVTFLHRAQKSPAPAAQHNPFSDVPEGSFYHIPVLWAVENGITNGLTATTFGPNAICNRAQIVTFLYRAFA